jgi:hypothetical protein
MPFPPISPFFFALAPPWRYNGLDVAAEAWVQA